jgi:hypothetical protein
MREGEPENTVTLTLFRQLPKHLPISSIRKLKVTLTV